jgi:hypothetical protein
LEDADVCRRTSHRWPHGDLHHRRRHGWSRLPRLCPASAGANTAQGRHCVHGQPAFPQGRGGYGR